MRPERGRALLIREPVYGPRFKTGQPELKILVANIF